MTATPTALFLLLTFAIAPAEHPVPTEAEPPTAASSHLTELDAALAAAAPTEASARQLAEALERSQAQALELVDDPEALDLLDRARLALVSIHLATGDEAGAQLAMDEAIRSAMGRDIAPGRFGPSVLELHERRLAALAEAGTASLAIACEGCEVVVNEATLDDPDAPLYLGSYRVWVVFADPGRDPEHFEVALDRAGSVAKRSFLPEPAPDPGDQGSERGQGRLLPRWMEIAGLSLGAASLISGALLASMHHTCRGDSRSGDLDLCEQWYDNRPQDLVLISLGAGLMVASGVTLTYDELRVGQRRDRRAMMIWTLRF